jgi:hypothetical protein
MPELLVRKEITVEASQSRAFDVFTRELGVWWPLASHHIGALPAETAVIEPRAGGRWFERAADGSECDWGRVLVWDPPGRLVLSWEISADFKRDPRLDVEVEVRFVAAGPALTRVEVEHRHLDRYAEAAVQMRGIFDGENGWSRILQTFAARMRR